SRPVTVANVAPTATLGNGGPVDEGSPVSISFTAQFDPSPTDTTAGLRYAYSCTNGDLSTSTYALASTSASTDCTFPDGPATKTVKARIIDKDGGSSQYTTNVRSEERRTGQASQTANTPCSETRANGTRSR